MKLYAKWKMFDIGTKGEKHFLSNKDSVVNIFFLSIFRKPSFSM